MDFGAGCGRLTFPLARAGYRLTAVEPSAGMTACLEDGRRSLAATDPDGASRIRTVIAPMEEYAEGGRHDLALCVFTVISYLVDRETLTAAFRSAFEALVPGGTFLLDVPDLSLFESFEVDSADMIRDVTIEPVGPDLYDYRESTVLRDGPRTVRFEDRFTMRHWPVAEVRGALREVGFGAEEDVSDRFPDLGARYLLFRRPA